MTPHRSGPGSRGSVRSSWSIVPGLMSAWYRWTASSFTSIPRPLDGGRVTVAGPHPVRVLLAGSGPAEGWGVVTHELGLAGHIARVLSTRLSRGVDVVVRTDRRLEGAVTALTRDRSQLGRFDAVILTTGVAPACSLVDANRWEVQLNAALGRLEPLLDDDAIVVVAGIPPVSSLPEFGRFPVRLAERHGRRLNDVSRGLCSSSQRVFVELPAPTTRVEGRHRGSDGYAEWAAALALPVARSLSSRRELRAEGDPRPRQDEEERQRAVESLDLVQISGSEALKRIVAVTRSAFGAATAMITVIDGDRQISAVTSGVALPDIPREIAFCDVTIRRAEELVVPDAALDGRFFSNPLVTSGQLGFYAGYPIETAEGMRVGALCVVDPDPRIVDEVSTAMLRDLAVMVQREIERYRGSEGVRPRAVLGERAGSPAS